MNYKDIHVGDVLRIRDWDDMVAEFGLAGQSIDCRCYFGPDMQYLCGRTITVKHISQYELNISTVEGYEMPNSPENPTDREWFISCDMLEPIFEDNAADESYEPISPNELREFLNSNADEVNNGH